jgi:uncharacterized RmlC-like cupin family protein
VVDSARPMVIHPSDAASAPGPPTPGMNRRQLLDEANRWIGWVQTTAGLAGGWHHHGDRDTYVFMTRGSLVVEFGPGGSDSVTMSAGDLGFVPPRMIHREITTDDGPAEAFVIRLGTGPQNVNVDAPDPT